MSEPRAVPSSGRKYNRRTHPSHGDIQTLSIVQCRGEHERSASVRLRELAHLIQVLRNLLLHLCDILAALDDGVDRLLLEPVDLLDLLFVARETLLSETFKERTKRQQT